MIVSVSSRPIVRELTPAELSLVAGGYSSEIVVTGSSSNWFDDWGWMSWDNSGYDYGSGYDEYGGGNGGSGDSWDPTGDDDGDGILNQDEEIVVTATPPTPIVLDPVQGLYGQFYPDGIVVLSHWVPDNFLQDWFGFGGHYESMGTFTYTAHVDGTQASWSNTVNTTPPGMGDTITVQYGNVDYDFTRVQEQ